MEHLPACLGVVVDRYLAPALPGLGEEGTASGLIMDIADDKSQPRRRPGFRGERPRPDVGRIPVCWCYVSGGGGVTRLHECNLWWNRGEGDTQGGPPGGVGWVTVGFGALVGAASGGIGFWGWGGGLCGCVLGRWEGRGERGE